MTVRVLALEASATLQRVLQIALADADVALHLCDASPAAYEAALALRPDAVLASTAPGEADGYALCGELRADPRTASIPVLLLGTAQHPYDPARGNQVGAQGGLERPCSAQALLEAVVTLTAAATTTDGRPAQVPPRGASEPLGWAAATRSLARPQGDLHAHRRGEADQRSERNGRASEVAANSELPAPTAPTADPKATAGAAATAPVEAPPPTAFAGAPSLATAPLPGLGERRAWAALPPLPDWDAPPKPVAAPAPVGEAVATLLARLAPELDSDALNAHVREVVEREVVAILWEVVPKLAEAQLLAARQRGGRSPVRRGDGQPDAGLRPT